MGGSEHPLEIKTEDNLPNRDKLSYFSRPKSKIGRPIFSANRLIFFLTKAILQSKLYLPMTTLSIAHQAKMTRFEASLRRIPSDSPLVEGLAASFLRNKAERDKDALLAAKIKNDAFGSLEEKEQTEKEILVREEARLSYLAALDLLEAQEDGQDDCMTPEEAWA